MHEDLDQFENRKRDHIELALRDSNQTKDLNTLDELVFMHEALPDLNFADIIIDSNRLGQKVAKPFFVSSMTAGHQHSSNINLQLIEACSQSNWAMGVGSQRRELFDEAASNEWYCLRRNFSNVSLFSNLGIAQAINT